MKVELYTGYNSGTDTYEVCYDAAQGHEREWREYIVMTGLLETEADKIVEEANRSGNPLTYLSEVYGI